MPKDLEAPRVVIKVHEENVHSIQFATHIGFRPMDKKLINEPQIQLFVYDL